jgi:hypothetical protein
MGKATNKRKLKSAQKRARKAHAMKRAEGEGKSRYAQKCRLKRAGHHIGMWWHE